METPPLPCRLVTDLYEAVLRDLPQRIDEIQSTARAQGAALAPEIASTLRVADGLTNDVALDLYDVVADVVFSTDAPECYEVLFRHIADREPDNVLVDLEDTLIEHEPRDWTAFALPLRDTAIAEDNEMLRRISSFLLASAEPGEPGVLDALLDEYEHDAVGGTDALCLHGDAAAAPTLLEWLHGVDDLTELDSEQLGLACDAAIALLDWGVALGPKDRQLCDDVIEAMTAHLEWSNEGLRAELVRNETLLRELRRRGPGAARPAGPRRTTGRNQPCACGSGKKAKMCCN